MEQAILKTLKDAGGTYAFPGGAIKVVDLFCGGQPNIIKEVIINSSFTEFTAIATGRIAATKIISACGDYTTFVTATKKDVESLQSCCNDTKNYFFDMACVPAFGFITVFDIFGNYLGTASTPLEYVTTWNASANNALIGKLYVYPNWNVIEGGLIWIFTLSANVGSYVPPSFPCVITCPVATANVVGTTASISFTGQPGRSYFIRLFSNSDGTGPLSSLTYTNSTSSPQTGVHGSFSGLPSGTYYCRVVESLSTYNCNLISFVIA